MEFTGYLDFWFTNRPLLERVEAFKSLGISRYDIWCWRQVDMSALAAACRANNARINSTFDDDMGSLVDPADNEKTYASWAESLEMAVKHDVQHLFIFSNQIDIVSGSEWTRRLSANIPQEVQYSNLLDQTDRIMKMVEQTDVEVWVEALNEFHIQGGVLVHDHDLAADWVRRVNHPQFRLAFDCYHQQRTAGNLIYGLETYRELYPTVHIGDVPTRQEPGTGEINFPNIAAKLRELQFDGLIGMEFRPSTTEAQAWQRVKDIFQVP